MWIVRSLVKLKISLGWNKNRLIRNFYKTKNRKFLILYFGKNSFSLEFRCIQYKIYPRLVINIPGTAGGPGGRD